MPGPTARGDSLPSSTNLYRMPPLHEAGDRALELRPRADPVAMRVERCAREAAGESDRSAAVTEHAVVIAGGGPTGLMLAAELALAGIDVTIVERRAGQELDGSRSGGLHSRTIEVLDQRGVADRFLAEGQAVQVQAFAGDPARHQRLPDPPQLRARALAEPLRAHPGRLGRRAGGADRPRARGDGLRAGRRRRRRRAVRRPIAASGLPRRVRRRAQRGPQGGRHRVRRVGPDAELADRRGRDGRGAGARPARGRRHRPLADRGLDPASRCPSSTWTTPASPPCRTSARR